MCGIAGILNLADASPPEQSAVRRMLGMIRHRGPDQFGIYLDDFVALGSARLSIIDLDGGQQPITNETGELWIVFNGEVFNYPELREKLEGRGHRFSTRTDTEVVLHLFEDLGPKCLEELNGQFAIAIWDTRTRRLFLARDRLGVRPLFYTLVGGSLIFGSEIKAILAEPRVCAEIDAVTLDQVFTFWSPLSPRTAFKRIVEVPPGTYLLGKGDQVTVRPYWRLEFPSTLQAASTAKAAPCVEERLEEFKTLLIDAVKIRLRADVPVGAYLSGGLDSSTIAAVIRNYTGNRLDTFSIAFTDVDFDESSFQQQMARFLGTDHQVVRATHADIGRVFPQVIWHAEVPILRTAPAPMLMLSQLVRSSGYKVVLTGEGADEFLAGYDIFKEAKVRRFWASQPESTWRPLLLKRLYPDIKGLAKNSDSILATFFRQNLTDTNAPEYSHALRWRNGRRNARFFSDEVKDEVSRQAVDGFGAQLHPRFNDWDLLGRAQYLEIKLFLSQYLLSSQGDRMGMANSIEGRFPFLDCRIVEFCARLPATLKLRGLTEKYLLRKLGQQWLPEEVWRRAKRPYRAPIHRSFFNPDTEDYVRELLSFENIKASGLFKPSAVVRLVEKIRRGVPIGESDDMALAGILSTQLVHFQFVAGFHRRPSGSLGEDVKVCRGGNRTLTGCKA